MNRSCRHIDTDQVAGFYQRQRPADIGLGRAVQHAGAVARAAHAGIRQAQHVAHTLLHQFGRYRQHAPLGHARAAQRAGIAQHQDVVGVHIEIGVVDRLFHRGIVVEDQCASGVLEQVRRAGARFDHHAVRGEVASQHGERAFGIDRV